MTRKKRTEQFQSSLATRTYSLLFIVLAFWTSIPVFLNANESLECFRSLGPSINLIFSSICIIASIGTLTRHHFLGRFLGLGLLSCVVTYQALRLFTDPVPSPLLILSLINFCIVIVVFEKIIPKHAIKKVTNFEVQSAD